MLLHYLKVQHTERISHRAILVTTKEPTVRNWSNWEQEHAAWKVASWRAGDVAQVVEYKHEALSSTPTLSKQRKWQPKNYQKPLEFYVGKIAMRLELVWDLSVVFWPPHTHTLFFITHILCITDSILKTHPEFNHFSSQPLLWPWSEPVPCMITQSGCALIKVI
jgi:hypothetical protein